VHVSALAAGWEGEPAAPWPLPGWCNPAEWVLPPVVDMVGEFPVRHGERDRHNSPHPWWPEACLCGHHDYGRCPEIGGGSLVDVVLVSPDDADGDGQIL
jgi:hypothetical protein